ncbi:MAG: hypothetical protein ACR2QV_08955 [Gammaproteobacteria bacterium]
MIVLWFSKTVAFERESIKRFQLMRRKTDIVRIVLLLVLAGSSAQAGGLFIREIGRSLQGASHAGDAAISNGGDWGQVVGD